ncbi:hypothetical protein RB195_014997 [Necator americanus]|uniref:Tectonin beta-propeller repeat-containing protein 2 n=1 Tax=Necator americanus TaxID=51031 RepID=A0ABR1E2K2_NECAM
MEVADSLNVTSQVINEGSKEVIYDSIDWISRAIPETFDLGTIAVELTCVASSFNFVVFGTGCGTLFVYNKKLGRLARPLRTNSFEAQYGCRAVEKDLVHPYHNVLIRTVIADQLSRVASGDASGTVILSTVTFDTGEFYHCFLFEDAYSIAALEFSGESVIIHNGSQLLLVNTRPQMDTRVICDHVERTVAIGIRCTASFVYVAEKFRLCKYSTSLYNCGVIATNAVVGGTGFFVSVEWNLDGTKLAVLSSSNVFVMFDLIRSEVLWRAPLNDYLRCFVGDFCVDDDDSILYVTKPRGFHRVGVTTTANFINKGESDLRSTSLLSSPKKLLSNSAFRVTQRGFSFLNNALSVAKDITVNSEVSSLLEDALKKMDIQKDAEHVKEVRDNATDRKDLCNDSMLAAYVRPPVNIPPIIKEHHDVFVKRKEKIRCKKGSRSENMDRFGAVETENQVTIDEGTILALRKEVLGNNILCSSPCSSGASMEETLTCSPGESPLISGLYMKASDCTKTSSTPSSSRDSSTVRRGQLTLQGDEDNENNDCKDGNPSNASYFVEPTTNTETSSRGAESVTSAYEYLLHKNVTKPSTLEFKPSTSNGTAVLLRNQVIRERSQKNVVLNDQVDIWMKIFLPYTAKSFAVGCDHIVLCHKKKTPRILSLDALGSKKPLWLVAKWSADSVAMNDRESIVWRVHNNAGWCAVDSLTTSTRFEECATDGGGVIEVSVGSNIAWYLTREGVSVQMELPEKAIFSRVDCDWTLRSISASDDAVWAIRRDVGSLVVRVGLARCRMGLDWIEIVPEGPSKLVSVCVYRSYGFALDDTGRLWMSTGVDRHHPYGSSDAFYKVCLPFFDGKAPPTIAWTVKASSTGLFLCAGKVMLVVRSALSAHRFPREVPAKFDMLDNFSMLSSGSYIGCSGYIYLCRQDSEIFVYRPTRRNFVTISIPSTSQAVVSLCGTRENLSLIDSAGKVFHCDGESPNWVAETDLPDCVCSIAQSKLARWAITCTGALFIKQAGSNIWNNVIAPADVESKVVPAQVFTSPNGIYVWVLSDGRGWARTNVNERNPAGVKWTETYHTSELYSLAVGDNVVWALDSSGQLLRLRGLAAGNPAGNYWRPISQAVFREISVDAQSELWAIDMENRLVRHLSDVYVPEQLFTNEAPSPFELI